MFPLKYADDNIISEILNDFLGSLVCTTLFPVSTGLTRALVILIINIELSKGKLFFTIKIKTSNSDRAHSRYFTFVILSRQRRTSK